MICFNNLCETFGLDRQDFFRYLQLRDYFSKTLKGHTPSAVTQTFVDAYNSGNNKGIVSKLYRGLTTVKMDTTDYVKQRWEKELGIKITREMWLNAWKTQFSSTNSKTWRDFCWKNLIRFFITPKQKAKQTDSQHGCWRECGEVLADHTHIFWSCPVIQPYWNKVTEIISKVIGCDINTTFTSLYLGIIPDSINAMDAYLLKILLAASKKAITKHWLQKNCPPPTLFVNIVKQLHVLEQMTYSIRLQKDQGEKRWIKWCNYLANGIEDQ